MNEHGKIVSCKCVDFRKCFKKGKHKDHGKIPKPPTKSVRPKSSVTHESDTKPTKHGVVVTQYGIVVKQPEEWICK